ncbi:MAG TPA: TrbI/VirB10 family protein [Vicinamibacteria bacterium]|jgi:type IV secretory pathway VirB10-like protein|nr:TrbI/VirB10 family protein [Vicinamibacteria bacterium]
MPETPTKGVLPKNLQAWILGGIALVVVLVIALAGASSKQSTKTTPAASASPNPGDEITRRLAQLQADQEKLQREATLAQQQLELAQGQQPASPPPQPVGEDTLEKEKAKREYTSLFASQVAQTYRPPPAGTPAGGPPGGAGARSAPAPLDNVTRVGDTGSPLAGLPERLRAMEKDRQSLDQLDVAAATASGATTAPVAQPAAPTGATRKTTNQVTETAQLYHVLEGTVLETVLVTRLVGDFSGPVLVQTTAPLFSRDRQHVLVPAGARAIGEAKKTEALGQNRLAVAFHRLIMPDGYSVDLDRFSGLSARGETALEDQVNNHYFKMFGASIALGLIGGLSAVGTQPLSLATSQSTLDQYRMGVAGSFGQVASRVLDRFTNILPTITIREGHRVRVWIAQDLPLPAYADHRMPKDF